MKTFLKNKSLTVMVDSKGAELQSIKSNLSNLEYIWNGDEKYWIRHSPILFPIVGKVKNDLYRINGREYTLTQHGFARDCEFELIEHNDTRVVFRLLYTETSLKVYPYKFSLDVIYTLNENTLSIENKVNNLDENTMLFSIGAHPGFNCPILENESMEDYYFEFEKEETVSLMLINKGFFTRKETPFLNNSKIIPINKKLFEKDALVFHNLKSQKIYLKSKKSSNSVCVDFKSFPYLGLWSKATGAPFVCIEPWYSHGDFEDFNDDFSKKSGIIKLAKDSDFTCAYSITITE